MCVPWVVPPLLEFIFNLVLMQNTISIRNDDGYRGILSSRGDTRGLSISGSRWEMKCVEREQKTRTVCFVTIRHGRGGGGDAGGVGGVLLLGGLWMEKERSVDLLSQKFVEVC